MKKIIMLCLFLSGFSYAEHVEGTLILKLKGELDATVLGDGCLSIVNYYHSEDDRFYTIGIYQPETDSCISDDVEENEQIEFDTDDLIKIKNKETLTALKELSELAQSGTGVGDFFEIK
jgi:hypothetical protein